jgi:hypothetical protein
MFKDKKKFEMFIIDAKGVAYKREPRELQRRVLAAWGRGKLS